jgi:hypothetical protein
MAIGTIEQKFLQAIDLKFQLHMNGGINDAETIYNFDIIDVDGKTEVTFKCLMSVPRHR